MPTSAFTRHYGPTKPSRLNLMGIRFIEGEGDGSGAGDENKFTPPATQADLDKILSGAVARTHKQYEGFEDYKSKAEQFDKLADDKKTPDQRAIDEAREEGRAEVRAVLAGERVKSAFDAALKGRTLDAAALLDFDRSKFIKGDAADSEAITKWITANSTEVKTGNGRDPGQGNRGDTHPVAGERGKAEAARRFAKKQ
jgi:hypothetical protein